MSEIVKIENPKEELAQIIKGIDLSEADVITNAYLPFLQELEEIKRGAAKIDIENPSELDEQIAGALRKQTVKIRTGAKALKDERKKIYLLKGGIEQNAFNLIESICQLAENKLKEIEQAKIIALQKKQQLLNTERIELLKEFDVDGTTMNLGSMTQDVFDNFLAYSKDTYAKAQIALQEAENERVRLEQIKELHETRKNKLLGGWNFVLLKYKQNEDGSPFNLGLLSNEEFEICFSKAKEAFKADKAKQQAVADENEKLKAENEAKEKAIEQERKTAEDKAKKAKEESERLAKIESDKQAKILADEKAKSDKLAKELADRKAKEKVIADKLAADVKAEEEAKKKVLKAPDKDKLKLVVNSLSLPQLELKSTDAEIMYVEIQEGFDKFIEIANKKIDTL